jgi:hypothetical protein
MFVLLHAGFDTGEYRIRKPVRVEEGVAHASARGHRYWCWNPTVNTISEAMISVGMGTTAASTALSSSKLVHSSCFFLRGPIEAGKDTQTCNE